MTREEAEIEITEWLRVGKRYSLKPESIIFPRDFPGFLGLLRSHGFICYRAETQKPLLLRNRLFGKYLKTLGSLLGMLAIPIHCPEILEREGMIVLHDSAHLFDFNRRLELTLDHWGLEYLRIRGIIKAVRKAAREGKIIHLWAHPLGVPYREGFLETRDDSGCCRR